MNKSTFRAGIGLACLALALTLGAQAKEDLINDILINPARYWNMQVTVVGEVQTVTPDPAGTTRGTYTLLDDSCPNTIIVRTKDLPPVGRAFRVTGLLLPVTDRANVPIIKETERTDASEFSAATRNLLIGLGAALVVLIALFVFLLLKPRKTAPAPSKPDAGKKADALAENRKPGASEPTIAVPQSAAQGGETQLLLNPNAELLVEQGNDKGQVFTINKNVTLIGRSGMRLNDVILTDNTVSKEQAQLQFDPITGRYSIVNESAKNPTKVNGIIASQPIFLKGGEPIEMGKTALRFSQR